MNSSRPPKAPKYARMSHQFDNRTDSFGGPDIDMRSTIDVLTPSGTPMWYPLQLSSENGIISRQSVVQGNPTITPHARRKGYVFYRDTCDEKQWRDWCDYKAQAENLGGALGNTPEFPFQMLSDEAQRRQLARGTTDRSIRFADGSWVDPSGRYHTAEEVADEEKEEKKTTKKKGKRDPLSQ